MIQNAWHFAEHVNEVCNVNVLHLDENDIQYPNIDGKVYVHWTLKFHPVKRVNEQSIEFLFNSQYKKDSEMLRQISYGKLVRVAVTYQEFFWIDQCDTKLHSRSTKCFPQSRWGFQLVL